MNKRYELTNMKVVTNNYGTAYHLTQIRALVDMPTHNVKAGDLGGLIEKEENLPMNENGWVSLGATVCGDAILGDSSRAEKAAFITGNAQITGTSVISGRALIGGSTLIFNSTIKTDVEISGEAIVRDSKIGGNTRINKKAFIENSHIVATDVLISGNVYIKDSKIRLADSRIDDNAKVIESTIGSGQRYDKKLTICGNAIVRNASVHSTRDVWIGENAQVLDHAKVSGFEITIKGMAVIKGYARVGLKTTIDEFAVLDGGVNKSPKYNHSFFGKNLTGEDVYIFGKTP
ncbi:hypothetical protein JMA_37380 (plasmid) [Jeotgalibacillus malaysiensis]|uniref:Mannose-1-phosphate guanyltransferase C-terminal domain-containing protein n=1 Tax=Jeotgalibacillus malaysiensis TaxID=1508404 RepID=A0A0B5ASG4_9BACL|nr:hypothetical protein [Jeotgalibacillus malaysiensis]AJD93056.1 hypothetical protein JMA_37380 [Jeotgalibacillus malaysiensis]